MKDVYEGQTYYLKKRVDIWTSIDVVPVEYVPLYHIFHLTLWLFQFITRVNFKWDPLIWRGVAILVWIVLWKKLRIY